MHTCSNEPVQGLACVADGTGKGLGRESLREERMKQTEISTQAGLTITRSRKQARRPAQLRPTRQRTTGKDPRHRYEERKLTGDDLQSWKNGLKIQMKQAATRQQRGVWRRTALTRLMGWAEKTQRGQDEQAR